MSRFTTTILWPALIVQAVAVLVFFLIPFGFDKRSSWGLDYDHLMTLLLIYGVALINGTIGAVIARRPYLAVAQLLVFTILAILVEAGAVKNA
jgi:hypothetical protein